MATKKKNLHLTYNSPISLSLVFICIVFFILDTFIFNGKLIAKFFTCPGKIGSSISFDFKNPLDYIKLVFHIFGNIKLTSLLLNMSFILLLGPILEERYGSPIVALAVTVVSVVTGVLNVCLSESPMTGSGAIVLLMIILASIAFFDKKELPLSYLTVFILYMSYMMYETYTLGTPKDKSFINFIKQNIPTFINLAGGICGSLFGFLVAPKKPRTNKRNIHEEDTISYTDSAVRKPDNRYSSNEDSTVIGQIDL